MYKVLTIAGSDSCCGAGIQADLKTISSLGGYGTCAITAITAQNTLGVSSVFAVPPSIVGQQIESVVSDIGVDSLKTGMLVNAEIVETVCYIVKKHNLKKLVIDPVIQSHNGQRLLTQEGIKKLFSSLMPLSCLITPNIPEAEILTGCKIESVSDIEGAAKRLCDLGAESVLIKGGHIIYNENNKVVDYFYDGKSFRHYREDRIKAENVHGTGCMYSAAIATELARGNNIDSAIRAARKFITILIRKSIMIGRGHRLADFSS